MIVVADGLMLCTDCLIAACNGDFTGIDSDARVAEVTAGLESCGPNLVPDFDSESGDGIEEFSWGGCDCCGSRLGGSRHRFAILGEPEREDAPERVPAPPAGGCRNS